MFPEEGYFYISEDELMRRSFEPQFQGKPLAWVFYHLIKERDLLNSFRVNRVQNFYNKVSDKDGAFEILFSDHSSFVMGTGAIKVIQPISDYFESFPVDYSCGFCGTD